jgi:putative transcriptional regulator|tara:strand:- start:3556 stop:4107 length:552 start_codon:yes stop_codon:yes gene_type:complete
MQNIENGSLLIAHPTMLDDTFFKGLILITHHNYEESIGIVINKPSKIKLHEIINDIPVSNFPVYIGGPVAKNSIHYIHNIGKKIPGAIKIINGLYFGGDFNIVKNLIKTKEISKNNIRFFAGYSGWEPNQLEDEIKENSWIIKKATKELCLQYSNENLWGQILRKMDKKYAIWSNLPENPSLN